MSYEAPDDEEAELMDSSDSEESADEENGTADEPMDTGLAEDFSDREGMSWWLDVPDVILLVEVSYLPCFNFSPSVSAILSLPLVFPLQSKSASFFSVDNLYL